MLASLPAPRADTLPPTADHAPGPWFHGATTLLLVLARDGMVRHANASAVRYAGGDALVGSLLWETRLVERVPSSRSAVRDAFLAALAGAPASLDVDRCREDGVVGIANLTLTPVSGGQSLLVEGHDVTAPRAATRRGRALLSAASHELRTPIVGVRGALGLVESGHAGPIDPRARHLVQLAQMNADRLMRCVTDLLDLERIRTGAAAVEPCPTPAVEIARTALASLAPLVRQLDLRVAVRDDRAGAVLADHDHTAHALAILFTHALGAAPGGSAVRVVASRPHADRVRLALEDPRGAISQEGRNALARQVDGAAPFGAAAEGAIGLAIVRALVARQGGAVGASAEADRGTVCWVELPAADETAVPLAPSN